MKHEVLCRPAASVVRFWMETGEQITCEAGSMIAMSQGMTVETTTRTRGGGGVFSGLRRMLAGESFFLNHFTAQQSGQSLLLGPELLGDVLHHPLVAGSLIVQAGSWLASTRDVQLDTSWQGFAKALLSGESLFWIKCTGSGDLYLSSYGAIYSVDVDGEYVVDPGHIVAFDETLQFELSKASSTWLQSFLGGEGIVCRFRGKGTVYCQSHQFSTLGYMLSPMLRPRRG